MKLYGTITSPYVRRVRILLSESGQKFDWVDTSKEEGLKELKSKTPLWKIPFLEVNHDLSIWDSRTISDYIFQTFHPTTIRGIDKQNHWVE
jgi:glutathione S-transferase